MVPPVPCKLSEMGCALLRRKACRPLHICRGRSIVQQGGRASCSMAGVRHMEVKSVRRHTGERGVRRPAEVRAAVRRIHLLQWEQIGSVSPCQKQVVGRLSEGQPLPVPEQVTAAQGGAAVTDQAEKTFEVLLYQLYQWFLFDGPSPFSWRPGTAAPGRGSVEWPAGPGRRSSAESAGAEEPG